MHLETLIIPSLLTTFTMVLACIALLTSFAFAPWRALLSVQTRQHAFFGGIICLVIIWSIKISWAPGLILHPLGITAFTVIFGWPLSIIAGAIALTTNTVLTHEQWNLISIDYLLTVLIPATVTHYISKLVLTHASRNLFLFLLGIGFFGAILGMLMSIMTLFLLAYSSNHIGLLAKLWHEFGILAMLLYAEGFLNGVAVAAITVFAPDLVKTFDSKKYLGEK